MANLNTLQRSVSRSKMRVGRGGKRGKTSGRGTKGQNARAGNKKRPELRDIIKKLPKRRGYGKNRARTVVGSRPASFAVSLGRLDALFENGTEITAKSFIEKGIVKGRGVALSPVKIVAGGEITKKFSISGVHASAQARAAIEKAGGSVR
ncbi:MAG TPA: uL15 family ribosomal protein [Candidatus Paceibacterota bacterium]|nr:uL15 family ribosomal protein [Candidatus Paceibacterota bacterium]